MVLFRTRFVFFMGALVGAAVMHLVPEARAVSQASDKGVHYRVIGESRDSTMEKELNELNEITDCKPVLFIAGSMRSDPMVILECR